MPLTRVEKYHQALVRTNYYIIPDSRVELIVNFYNKFCSFRQWCFALSLANLLRACTYDLFASYIQLYNSRQKFVGTVSVVNLHTQGFEIWKYRTNNLKHLKITAMAVTYYNAQLSSSRDITVIHESHHLSRISYCILQRIRPCAVGINRCLLI